MTIRESHSSHVTQGDSVQVLRANPRRNGLLLQNNGANVFYIAFGRRAVADNSCFKLASGAFLLLDKFCPRSDLNLIGTAGDSMVILESNKGDE